MFGGNTPTPSTYEILNMENVGDWMQTNLTLKDQAKESINSLKTIQTSLRLKLRKIYVDNTAVTHWQIIFKNFGLFSVFNIFFGSDSEVVTPWSHGR